MTVWRFGQIDRPAFGLSDLDRYFAAYEAAGGAPVDRARFDFWLVYRTLWWALGCLQMGEFWRSGVDRSFERTVISRRTSENELDLLMLLEGEASAEDRAAPLPPTAPVMPDVKGETSAAEILTAMSDWMNTDLKPKASGRDKFMVVMAMNALGMVRRELMQPVVATDKALADALLAGEASLATPGLLPRLRRMALDKLANDVPKYAALAKARALWEWPTAE
jgi:hypothetical protein